MKLAYAFLLFSIILSSSVLAYTPLQNKSLTLLINCQDIGGLNTTTGGNLYYMCYGSGTPTIYRFDENLTQSGSCSLGAYSVGTSTPINSSHLWGTYATNTIGVFNITNDAFGGGLTCNILGAYTIPTPVGSGSVANSMVYFGNDNTYDFNGNLIFSGNGLGGDFSFCDSTTNATKLYQNNATHFTYTTGGIDTLYAVSLWGISGYSNLACMKYGGFTYGYLAWNDVSNHYYIFQLNLTQATESVTVTNVEPQNATYNEGEITLKVSLATNVNGTLIFYVNDLVYGNIAVTDVTKTDYGLYAGTLTYGSYNYKVRFVSNVTGDSTNSTTTYFTLSPFGFNIITTSVTSWLGFSSVENTEALFSLVFSIGLSVLSVVYIKKTQTIVFVSVMIASLTIFWYIGWLPNIVGLLIFCAVGLMFAGKVSETLH